MKLSSTTRLIFPSRIVPEGVWGRIYEDEDGKLKTNRDPKIDLLQKRQETVLAWLKDSPGQTRDAIACRLEVSVETVRKVLWDLEKSGDIHHRPHPRQNKTKLYYVGSSPPSNQSTGKTPDPSKAACSVRNEPPLKVYFVDPRTLQKISR